MRRRATTTQWETEVVTAWGEEPDCSRSTGMCDACGLGATVVEIDDSGETTVRSIMTGPNSRKAPYNYDKATFEIASYTKHFTALSMVFLEKEIPGLGQKPIREFIPCNWDDAWYPGVPSITLEELRLHTSGLPPQGPNHDLGGGDGNPFAGYTEEMLCESLLAFTSLPTRGRFLYSNYGYGALGYALTIAAAKPGQNPPSYEDLMKETVLDPLGMNSTSVTLDKAGWKKAAKGCDRGMQRGEYAMRRGEYGVLQGNGALRSTLPDMSRFLEATLRVEGGFVEQLEPEFTPTQHILYESIKVRKKLLVHKEACTCVSGWCEGNLCPLPNPVKEMITDGGTTVYTSGGVYGGRKSGDTEGYSVRGAWSIHKGRAVFVVDTCGGCGERGTSGSAAQRVALLLADGPPEPTESPARAEEKDKVYRFNGIADSHVYPSLVNLDVEVNIDSEGTTTVAVASSDGAGCTATARPIEDGWEFDSSVLYGCGLGGNDPLAKVPQKRSLRLLPGGNAAILQEMGEDIYLKLAPGASPLAFAMDSSSIRFAMSVAILFFSFSWYFRR